MVTNEMFSHWSLQNGIENIIHELVLFIKQCDVVRSDGYVCWADDVLDAVSIDRGNRSTFPFVPLFLILEFIVMPFVSLDSTTEIISRCTCILG